MFINYLKATIRSLLKNKIFSTINILGLAIGLASFFFIIIYIFNELMTNEQQVTNNQKPATDNSF